MNLLRKLYINVVSLLFLSEKEKEDIFIELGRLNKIILNWKVNYVGDSYKYILNEDIEKFLKKLKILFSGIIISNNDEQLILSIRKLLVLGMTDRVFAILRVLLYSSPRIWRKFDSILGILVLNRFQNENSDSDST